MKIGPKYKIARRLGAAVFDKTQTQKFMLSEARHAKGRGRGRRPQISGYGLMLIEKQRVRYTYGVSEKQLSNYVKKASAIKGGTPAENLYKLLETRLDNVVYRLGLANSRQFARQMVSHGHITVNGTKTRIPSYTVTEGMKIGIREGSKGSPMYADLAKKLQNYTAPKWLKFNVEKLEAEIVGTPVFESDGAINLNTVFEYYSR